MSKPLIQNSESFFCPVYPNVYWSLKPAIEAHLNPRSPTATNTDERLWERYNRVRSNYLEKKALKYLDQALKHAQVYQNLKYEVEEDDQLKQVELDGLVLLDSALFLLEGKAGTVSLPARRGAKERMIKVLGELVEDAYKQALRAKHYIQQTGNPTFYLEDGTVVKIDKDKINRVFLVTVTLDDLSAFTTNLYKLQEIDLFKESEFPWTVALSDLRVISEIVEFPSQIVHYLERRHRLNELGFAEAHDELDWFGYYLMEGLYFEDINRQDKPFIFNLLSYTTEFDDYYFYRTGQRKTPASKPTQPMPDLLRKVLAELEAAHPEGYLRATCTLLNMNQETREDFADKFTALREQTLKDQQLHDFTLGFSGPSFGITCMFAPVHMAPYLEDRLAKYCILKKYQTKSDLWIGLGNVADMPDLISLLYIHDAPWEYDEDLEKTVKKYLPPLTSRQDGN
jgi:hypothetical protein